VSWATLCFIGSTGWAEPREALSQETAALSDWLSGDGITGTWRGLRSKLTDRGFELIGSYDAEGWGNTKGGLESGTVYTGLLDFGLKLDLEKAFGWRGASLSTTWLLLSGKNASEDLVGNFLTISNNAGFNTLRNYELWFQQNLLDDKISIRLGQLAADTEFVISDYSALFLNGTFGWPAFMYMNLPGGGPGFPVGTPGDAIGNSAAEMVQAPDRSLSRQCLCTERESSRLPLAFG
jgi:porin